MATKKVMKHTRVNAHSMVGMITSYGGPTHIVWMHSLWRGVTTGASIK